MVKWPRSQRFHYDKYIGLGFNIIVYGSKSMYKCPVSEKMTGFVSFDISSLHCE